MPNIVFSQTINLDQKISIQYKKTTALSIIQDIEQQTQINFSYNSKLLKDKKNISYSANNKSISEIFSDLSEILDIDFIVSEGQMVIKKKRKKDQSIDKKKPEIYNISGTIKDIETGESLIGATILVSGTRIGTITNNYGFFSLALPKGNYNIELSYVGFLTDKQNIKLDKNIKLSSNLAFDYQMMEDVIVVVDEQSELISNDPMSQIKIQAKDLKRFPEFAGEVGLIKTMESLPGIKTFGDGSSFYFVRGGNKDQNLILLDEAPIYNPSHLMGFYSVINPETAKEIKIYKADMPVRTGDKISSLTEIQTRDGNMKNLGIAGMINPLVFRLSIESPIVKEKISLFASFRHSTFNWIFRKSSPNVNIYFYDINFKLKYKLNDNNRIYFSFFSAKDNISNINSENLGFGIDWRNFASTLRWNHIFNEYLFSNTTLYGSSYKYNLNVKDEGKIKWQSEIKNLSLKTDFTYYTKDNNTVDFGYQIHFHSFNPGSINLEDIQSVAPKQSNQIVFYACDKYKLSDKWAINLGFRIPIWNNYGPTKSYIFDSNYQPTDTLVFKNNKIYKTFVNVDPRLSIKYQVTDFSSLKLSYGIYHQYIHLMSNSAGPFTSLDVWLPSGLNIKPQRSDIVAIGYNIGFKKGKYELISELYYKKMANQIEYADHANMLLNPFLEGELRFGEAYSYGLELMLRKRKGRLTGWLSYTYSRVLMQFDAINGGKEFPAYFDKPHEFSIFFSYMLTERLFLSGNWIYTSGSAINIPIGFYEYMGNTLPIYGEKNNDRLPSYHRLDISINWRLNKRDKRFKHSIAFSIYNLYNRKNAINQNYNKIRTGDNSFSIPSNVYDQNQLLTTQQYLVGFMPSFTYKFKF